ncbi:MAG: FkbM family methyltransferase [Pseudomonadales bacterium]|nr:FkbM family methyltransferase [Pseudomonadales bacterium]
MSKLISTYDALRFPILPKKTYLKYQAKRATNRQEHELALLPHIVPRNCNAIDGGAHKGIYSYYLSKLCQNVEAFEPNPTMYNYLKAAVPKNVNTYEVALSDKPGPATFHLPTSPGRFHHTQGSLMDVSGDTGAATIDVEVKTLDSYQLSNIGFLKLDLEGYELPALKGAANLIERDRPVVLAEATGIGSSSPDELVDYMLDSGYIALVYNEGRLLHYGKNPNTKITHNCIFLPE